MSKNWLFCLHSSLVLVLAVTNNTGKLSCPNGNYGIVTSEGKLVCKDCSLISKCPHGMGMSTLVECGDIIHEKTLLYCVRCVPGKNFSSTFDNSMCQPCQCTMCKPKEAFDGECTDSIDTTKCNGKCIKGYHTKTDSVDDCEPCAKCYGPNAKRVQKCIADNVPNERHCEPHTGLKPEVVNTAAAGKGEEDKEKSNGIKDIIGHPVLFASLMVLICVLFTYVLVQWAKKYFKPNKSRQNFELAERVQYHPVQNPRETVSEADDVLNSQRTGSPTILNNSEDGHEAARPDNGSPVSLEPKANSDGLDARRPILSHDNDISHAMMMPSGSLRPRQRTTGVPHPELVSGIPHVVLQRICILLNIRYALGSDYRTLASMLGMKNSDIRLLSNSDNPCEEVLKWWETKRWATVDKFREILMQMRRNDVLAVLDERD